MVNFKIKVANKVFEINAFYEFTKKYCRDFLCEENPDYFITMSEQDLINEVNETSSGKVYVSEEISALYRKIADILLEYDIIVFHGSSFMVNNQGFIVTARSGVGKSTHVKLLEEFIGDSFKYINDDKPLLEVKDNVIIHSNPWNGKERRGNNISVPLKAILFLARSKTPTYKKIDNKEEAYIKLMSQTYLPREKTKREKALNVMDALFNKTNFYEINVNQNIESAKMTYERIIKNETK